jgi:hypothetical protein
MEFGSSIRRCRHANLGEEQGARKLVRGAGIGDDEDGH